MVQTRLFTLCLRQLLLRRGLSRAAGATECRRNRRETHRTSPAAVTLAIRGIDQCYWRGNSRLAQGVCRCVSWVFVDIGVLKMRCYPEHPTACLWLLVCSRASVQLTICTIDFSVALVVGAEASRLLAHLPHNLHELETQQTYETCPGGDRKHQYTLGAGTWDKSGSRR